jgi:hypothetical protein
MKKLILTGLVIVIGLAPAFAAAQSPPGGGTRTPSGTGGADSGTGTPGTSTPGTTSPSPSPSMPSAPSDRGATPPAASPSTADITNKADCDRAGGKWSAPTMKCDLGK